jgi:serine/threonine protein kinase/class 3 adenylate cyclase
MSWDAPGEVEEYRIIRPLGAGAMGVVFLAHDTLLDRAVAIKFVSALEVSAGKRERFLIEARAVARLSHPNVVTVYRVSEFRQRPYLVSEYVRGMSLAALPKPVAWPRVLKIAIGLARGLGAAHRRGVLHRDIKPANVMLGIGDEPKLLDFGLAKLVRPDPPPWPPTESAPDVGAIRSAAREHALDATMSPSGSTTTSLLGGQPQRDAASSSGIHTADGAIVGTPLYLAPELWRGAPASASSDVYSLGVVVYELLTGRAPHAGLSLPALAARAQAEDLPPIASLVADLPAPLASLIDASTSRDPSRRPGSGDALCELLEAIAQPAITVGAPGAGPSAVDAAGVAGERRRVAVLFCDLRGFGAFSQTGGAAEVLDRLNQYFDSMAAAIAAHGGTIDKFIGDAVLAVFGGTIPLVSPAEAALDAALAMHRALHALNQGWISAGLAPLDHSTGLEFGEVLYGSVGSRDHKAITVLGDVVNSATVLERETRKLGVPILISEALAVALPPERRAALTPLGEIELRRSAPPVAVFGVAG